MSDVSVVGTGAMGSALVEALAAAGGAVTVWNRTTDKAETLSGRRVGVARSVAEALTASPLTIVAVSDHELARTLVQEAQQDLEGKVVASTSFVTPDQGEAFATVVSAVGGRYLDLEIAASPGEVRSGDGVFLVSGPRAAYEAHREWFERIGRATYVNDAPAAAYVSGMAVQLAFFPMAVGLLQGFRIAAAQGLSPDWFKEAVLGFYPFHIERLVGRVTAEPDASAPEVEASVDVMAAGAAEYAGALRQMGLDAGMFDALHRLFTVASESGHGEDDWTGIAEHVTTPVDGR
jgi:3-hydroxyisobutyrate dehydrogenase-like beta-hydroxyacid dehydrogenase